MEYAFLGTTGVRVSRLCLGTMSFADDAVSAAQFARARDVGINYFDCADVYHQGRSEQILGKLTSQCRDEVVIASKVYFPTGEHGNARGASRYHITRAVEASLRRLGTDRIDVYYVHRFDDATALEDTLYSLELLTRQGKILYPAVSNFAAWQVARALGIAERRGWAPIACVQPMYNLAKRQAEVEILPMCDAERLGVFTYSPLGGGLLTGKYGRERRPTSGRLVDVEMYATRYRGPGNYEIAERFVGLAAKLGHHPVTLAVAWVASHPAVTAPIIGARDVAQLEPSLAAAELKLDPQVRAQISALSPAPAPATDRNEESTDANYGAR